MPKKKEIRKIYTFTLLPTIKEGLERAAEKDHRSMSSLIEKIIADYLEKENIPLKSSK